MIDKEQTVLSVIGRVQNRRDYSLKELLTMDCVETEALLLACGSGELKGEIEGCRGVLLTDVINGAEVITEGHNDTKKMYIVASAEDGYCTVFSWQELFKTEVGEWVMIILEKEGRKVYEEHGEVDLFSARDYLTGPRYVKQIKNIEIIMVEL